MATSLAILLLAFAPSCLATALVRAAGAGGFLSASGGIEQNLIAKKFATIEDDWKSQALVEVLCGAGGATGEAEEKCKRNSKLFQKSCSTIVDWLVQSNGKRSQKVKVFMDAVCTHKDLNGQQQERCQDLKSAVLGAMGEHKDSFRADGPCQSYWSSLVEQARLAQEEPEPAKAPTAAAVAKPVVAVATESSSEDEGDTAEDDEAEDDDDDEADESGSVAAAKAAPAAPAAPVPPAAPSGQKDGAMAAFAHQDHQEEETEEEASEGAETKTGAAPAQEGADHQEVEDDTAEESGESVAAASRNDATAVPSSDSEVEDDA